MIAVYCWGYALRFFYMVSALLLRSSNPVAPQQRELERVLFAVIDYGTCWAYGYIVARDSGSPAKGIAYAEIATY